MHRKKTNKKKTGKLSEIETFIDKYYFYPIHFFLCETFIFIVKSRQLNHPDIFAFIFQKKKLKISIQVICM